MRESISRRPHVRAFIRKQFRRVRRAIITAPHTGAHKFPLSACRACRARRSLCDLSPHPAPDTVVWSRVTVQFERLA